MIIHLAFIALFCIDYYLMYHSTKSINKNLTEKSKAHILSVKASTTLFVVSLYFNYKFMKSGFDINTYTNDLTLNENFIIELSVLNIISYFIMDCYLGSKEYHKYMCSLSGYFHHIIYIMVGLYTLKYDYSSFFILFLIEELPTVFLSLGQYNSKLRKNKTFGTTFFITRIVYHLFLIYKFKNHYEFLILGMLSLGVHSYWFKNWFCKWGFRSKTIEKQLLKKVVSKKVVSKKVVSKQKQLLKNDLKK